MTRHLVWCLSSNFGDEVSPYLFEKITGKRPIYAQPKADYSHVVACGSILNWAGPKSTVWGAGLASWKDEVAAAEIVAVRGPLSRLRAVSCGADAPKVYGDPALLLPRFYAPSRTKRYRVGIFPHYVDLFRANEWFGKNQDVLVIDPLQPVEEVVDQVVQCEFIFSSALHGLIVSDAYGVPNVWVRMSSSIGGDGMKYWDYLASVGRAKVDEMPQPFNWDGPEPIIREKLAVAATDDAKRLAEAIWGVCPWRWGS